MTKVENLKKVTLRLEAGTTVNDMNLSLPSSEFEFIFGIGPGGMCPFEYQLFIKPLHFSTDVEFHQKDTYCN